MSNKQQNKNSLQLSYSKQKLWSQILPQIAYILQDHKTLKENVCKTFGRLALCAKILFKLKKNLEKQSQEKYRLMFSLRVYYNQSVVIKNDKNLTACFSLFFTNIKK